MFIIFTISIIIWDKHIDKICLSYFTISIVICDKHIDKICLSSFTIRIVICDKHIDKIFLSSFTISIVIYDKHIDKIYLPYTYFVDVHFLDSHINVIILNYVSIIFNIFPVSCFGNVTSRRSVHSGCRKDWKVSVSRHLLFCLYAACWNSFVRILPIIITRNMSRSSYEETNISVTGSVSTTLPPLHREGGALLTHYVPKAEDIRSHWSTSLISESMDDITSVKSREWADDSSLLLPQNGNRTGFRNVVHFSKHHSEILQYYMSLNHHRHSLELATKEVNWWQCAKLECDFMIKIVSQKRHYSEETSVVSVFFFSRVNSQEDIWILLSLSCLTKWLYTWARVRCWCK